MPDSFFSITVITDDGKFSAHGNVDELPDALEKAIAIIRGDKLPLEPLPPPQRQANKPKGSKRER